MRFEASLYIRGRDYKAGHEGTPAPIYLFIDLGIYPSMYLSIYLSIFCISILLSIYIFSVNVYIQLYVYVYVQILFPRRVGQERWVLQLEQCFVRFCGMAKATPATQGRHADLQRAPKSHQFLYLECFTVYAARRIVIIEAPQYFYRDVGEC